MENKKKRRKKKEKKKKPSINHARYLTCQNELKEKNVSNNSNFPYCSCNLNDLK